MQTAIVGDGTMSRYEARDAFLEYQRLLQKNAGRLPEEDELLRVTYREISKGRRVLDLRETFRLSGLNELCSPSSRSRALTSGWCGSSTSWGRRSAGASSDDATRFSKSMLGKSGKAIAVPRGVFPQLDGSGARASCSPTQRLNWTRVRAAVPGHPAGAAPGRGAGALPRALGSRLGERARRSHPAPAHRRPPVRRRRAVGPDAGRAGRPPRQVRELSDAARPRQEPQLARTSCCDAQPSTPRERQWARDVAGYWSSRARQSR
jgi:hypothetical protein